MKNNLIAKLVPYWFKLPVHEPIFFICTKEKMNDCLRSGNESIQQYLSETGHKKSGKPNLINEIIQLP